MLWIKMVAVKGESNRSHRLGEKEIAHEMDSVVRVYAVCDFGLCRGLQNHCFLFP